MTDLQRFFDYLRAFELANLSGNWALLEPHFAAGARHRVAGGGPFGRGAAGGPAAVAADLAESVEGVDRRFDARIPEVIEGPEVRDDGIWMRFALTLRRAGLPELRVEGEHLAVYEGGRIRSLEERLAAGSAERVAAYLDEHAARLRPAGSPVALPVLPADRQALEGATLRSLVRCYGAAKSVQDAGAALSLCSEEFRLTTVSFGVEARDRKAAEGQLALFFAAFPDYRVTLEGFATGAGVVACWGHARVTFRGAFLGHSPTGRSAELPIFCVFDGANGQLTRERFFFDRAELCEQIGLAVDTLAQSLRPLRG